MKKFETLEEFSSDTELKVSKCCWKWYQYLTQVSTNLQFVINAIST